MRSVVVVFPASTWATMPMLRSFSSMVCSRGGSTATDRPTPPQQETTVRPLGKTVSADAPGRTIRFRTAARPPHGARERVPGGRGLVIGTAEADCRFDVLADTAPAGEHDGAKLA